MRNPLHHLDGTLESLFGTDLRLIYGMAAPMLLVIAVIMALVLTPSYWLVGATVVLELCCLAFVVTKLLAMLDETDSEFTGQEAY